jgi:hypothetical protein
MELESVKAKDLEAGELVLARHRTGKLWVTLEAYVDDGEMYLIAPGNYSAHADRLPRPYMAEMPATEYVIMQLPGIFS